MVVLSSAGHRFSDVDLDDPNFERTPYDPWAAYGRAKTANALFAVELDRRLRDRGRARVLAAPGRDRDRARPAPHRGDAGGAHRRRPRGPDDRVEDGAPGRGDLGLGRHRAASSDAHGGAYLEDCGGRRRDRTRIRSHAVAIKPYASRPGSGRRRSGSRTEEWTSRPSGRSLTPGDAGSPGQGAGPAPRPTPSAGWGRLATCTTTPSRGVPDSPRVPTECRPVTREPPDGATARTPRRRGQRPADRSRGRARGSGWSSARGRCRTRG